MYINLILILFYIFFYFTSSIATLAENTTFVPVS